MAIAPVNSVGFRNNYTQTNFEGKKQEKSSSSHMSSSVKAIPLATLIALSPLNTVEVNAYSASAEQNKTEKVILSGDYEDATPDGKTYKMVFYSTDGDDNDAEVATMRNVSSNKNQRMVNGKKVVCDYTVDDYWRVDTLEVKNITRTYKNRPKERTTEYYVKGPNIYKVSADVAPDGTTYGETKKKIFKNESLHITKDCYDFLKENMKSNVQYKVRDVVYDGDAEADYDELINHL